MSIKILVLLAALVLGAGAVVGLIALAYWLFEKLGQK
jgi:hypothetical protein